MDKNNWTESELSPNCFLSALSFAQVSAEMGIDCCHIAQIDIFHPIQNTISE